MTLPNPQPANPQLDQSLPPEQLASEQDFVPSSELNAWRRGFTPQAEIWNGRLAMLGLSVGLAVLLLVRLVSASH